MKAENASLFTLHASRYLFLILGVFVLSFLLPVHGVAFPICPFRWITGIPCFGCGLTRSVCSLSQGHVWTSLEYHPFGLVVYIVLVGLLLYVVFPSIRRRIDSFIQQKTAVVSALKWSIIGLFMLFGALRTYCFLI